MDFDHNDKSIFFVCNKQFKAVINCGDLITCRCNSSEIAAKVIGINNGTYTAIVVSTDSDLEFLIDTQIQIPLNAIFVVEKC